MESPITNVHQIIVLVIELGTSASENLTRRQWHGLWNICLSEISLDIILGSPQRGDKLDGAHHGNLLVRWNVVLQRVNEMLQINLNVHEDIENVHFTRRHWNQTTVGIMHHEIASQCNSNVIIDATCTIGDISHDEYFDIAKFSENVSQHCGKHGESLWHLQCNTSGFSLLNSPHSLFDFKIVIRRNLLNIILEIFVVQNRIWN
mmetsp:Transcript_5625/g.21158  ORF Transcript_5625/g.21158 Transcript_5625/m.21158 type:complete len:204 (-) Transcript_5625:110-721(-)